MIPGGLWWLAAGALVAGVGTLALVRHLLDHRGKPGANWLVAGLSAQALFCLTAGVSLFVSVPAARVAGEVLAWLALVWTGPLFLTFAAEYTGRSTPSTSRLAAPLAALMGLVSLAVVSAPFTDLVWRGVELERAGGVVTLAYAVGPAGYGVVLFGTVLASVGGLLLVDTVLSYGPLYRREAAAVAVSTLPPGVAILAWLAGRLPAPELAVVAVSFVPHVLCDAYAFVGNDMFETNPTTRRAAERTAVEDVAMPVVVLDPDDRVVDYNRAAEPLLTASPDEPDASADDPAPAGGRADRDTGTGPLGTPLSRVLDLGPAPLADGGDVATVETSASVRVDGDHREYVVSRSPLTDPAGTRVGTTLAFTDVTRERRREQRLDVLNRVLRHNLRNAMTVVAGNARVLRDQAETDRGERAAAAIDRSASELIDISEKAREFETVRQRGIQYRTVAVGEAVAAAATEGRGEAAGRLDVRVGEDEGEVSTDPKLLALVVENLVENAFEHAADPTVTVDATVSEGELRLRVGDDGPGIHADELAPLEAGTETALEHGTGIGLWLVEWSVTALGGTWSVDTDDGTTVTVRLPDGEDASVADDDPNRDTSVAPDGDGGRDAPVDSADHGSAPGV